MARLRFRRNRDPEGRMSLGDHLRELRNRTLISALAILVGSIYGWLNWEPLFNRLIEPVLTVAKAKTQGQGITAVTFVGLTDSFSTLITVGLFVGVVVASPVWLWQIWAFIVPGLTRREKGLALAFIGAAVPLFLAGCLLAFWVLPRAVSALLSFTPSAGSNILDVSPYLSFVLKFILVFGLGFLLPVFLVGLNVAHILSGRLMLRAWRGAVFLCFLFTAMMTPDPNPFTMIILAIPLAALYFAAVGVSLLLDKRRSKKDPSAAWLQVADDEASAL